MHEPVRALIEMTDDYAGMRRVQGGLFRMGSERFYPEEAPVRSVRLRAFWIDDAPVTNNNAFDDHVVE
jgi:sulfatase modifying factor 1